MSVYEAKVGGEDVMRHHTLWATLEEACIYVADFCKETHPPPGAGGRMWGKHRFGSVVYMGETKAEYWRAARGNTNTSDEFVKHIGRNVMRVLVTPEYLAYKAEKPQHTSQLFSAPRVGTMREEIARNNAAREEEAADAKA